MNKGRNRSHIIWDESLEGYKVGGYFDPLRMGECGCVVFDKEDVLEELRNDERYKDYCSIRIAPVPRDLDDREVINYNYVVLVK